MRSIFDRKCKSFSQSWNLHFSSVFNWSSVVHSSFDHERMTIWFVISHRHIRKISSSPNPRYPVTCISFIMSHNDNRYWLCVQLDERILDIRISLQIFIWEHRNENLIYRIITRRGPSDLSSKVYLYSRDDFHEQKVKLSNRWQMCFFENWILESSHSNITFSTFFLISCSDRIRTRFERTTTWLQKGWLIFKFLLFWKYQRN